ncbi:hypothetical protein DPEC_G00269690 [Dallia pectoralis]|uniref:Uncharacterized protein n=1 Tax=Dallia pectoralis TaxID=75939 RepID=A0ACC2FP44_DALPE|nr:hypothetical protein DPEC_G00269690 [Dallia pectoralis]
MFVHQITVPGTLPTRARLVVTRVPCAHRWPSVAEFHPAGVHLCHRHPPVRPNLWGQKRGARTVTTEEKRTHCLPNNAEEIPFQYNSWRKCMDIRKDCGDISAVCVR